MKRIKNMTELELFRQKLKYKEKLFEKDLIGSTADLTDHFTHKIRDFAFDFGMRMFRFLFSSNKQEEDSG
jgi:hypothetical protein